jgi:colicin import membrane protein
MVIRRDSLRAQTDFFSPMTGNTGTQIRYADAPVRRQETYGSRVKERLSDIGKGTRRAAPIMEAIKVAVQKTEDPFTRIQEKKSYAPEEENDMLGALEGAAGAAQDAIGAGVSQAETAVEEFRKGSNQRAAERRAERQLERQADLKAAADERAALRGDMKKLFERDRRMYGNTVPKGSMGSGSKPGPAVDTRTRHSVGTSEDQPNISKFEKKEDTVKTRTYRGQGGLKLGATTQRQGGTVKDGKKVEKSDSPAVKITNYKDIRQKRLDAREAARQAKRVTPAVKATGTPTGKNLKAGSFGFSKEGRLQAAINRGIAAAKKTGIPSNTAVQGGAMSQAARDQAAINRGIKAAEATGIPTKPVAGSFGISEAGRLQAAKNKAQAKAKAQAAKKTSTVSTTTKQGVKRTKAQMAAAKRKASGTSMSAAKAANKASMRDAARARHASFKKAKAAGTHARTASAQRARNKAAAKARAKAAAKARNARKKSATRRRSRRGRRRGRCDIFLKFDIRLLTNNNLRHDELAEVAYFVRALREVEL